MNATFGWPVLPSTDMPAGVPAYPLSSLGVRVRATPADSWTVLAGVFDGNPGLCCSKRDEATNVDMVSIAYEAREQNIWEADNGALPVHFICPLLIICITSMPPRMILAQ
ncbi:hypothetical protein OKW26_003644 [Paraburkholderia sp. 32]